MDLVMFAFGVALGVTVCVVVYMVGYLLPRNNRPSVTVAKPPVFTSKIKTKTTYKN